MHATYKAPQHLSLGTSLCRVSSRVVAIRCAPGVVVCWGAAWPSQTGASCMASAGRRLLSFCDRPHPVRGVCTSVHRCCRQHVCVAGACFFPGHFLHHFSAGWIRVPLPYCAAHCMAQHVATLVVLVQGLRAEDAWAVHCAALRAGRCITCWAVCFGPVPGRH